jgi:hypothetical protein
MANITNEYHNNYCEHRELEIFDLNKPMDATSFYISHKLYKCKKCNAVAIFHLIRFLEQEEIKKLYEYFNEEK